MHKTLPFSKNITPMGVWGQIKAICMLALLLIPLTSALQVNANEPEAGPNQIDTVYFKISGSLANLEEQQAELTYWAKDCEECTITGWISTQTQLYGPDQVSLPLRDLRKNRTYEANAIVFLALPGGLIQSIYLTQ